MSVRVEISHAWRVERASVHAPENADPGDILTFVRPVMSAAVESGRAGGRAVADGAMTPPQLEQSA